VTDHKVKCDTDQRPFCWSLSDTTAEMKIAEVEEKPLIQSDKQEEVIPGRVKGGTPHPSRGDVDHEGHTCDGEHVETLE